MYDLTSFALSDMLECGVAVREVAHGAASMEEAASRIVQYVHGHFVEKATGTRSVALARFYKSLPYERLEPALQEVVDDILGPGDHRGVRCLTLLATAGDERAWNDRTASANHRVIPLVDADTVAKSPMIAKLVEDLGLSPHEVVQPPGPREDVPADSAFDVFHVADAASSPHVPAKDFVAEYGIRSVLGFGGMLPSGGFFALLVFSRTPIPAETADAFGTIALSVKLAVLPFVEGRVFESDDEQRVSEPGAAERAVRNLRAEVLALEQLLSVRHKTILQQSLRLEHALQVAEERAAELASSQVALSASEARKGAILATALDPIITVDAEGRVVEWNPAAEATFGYKRDEVVGSCFAELIVPDDVRDAHRRGFARHLATGEARLLNRRVEVEALRRDGTRFPVELTITRVDLNGPPVFTGYLRDVTDRRRAEAQLLESSMRSARIAHALQQSLLPPALPEIPGIELASAYHASGRGNDVGGDFYDVFATAKDDWTLVLGDVCGKGPEAAALTALARYTVRAGAIRERRPSAVLRIVNDAVLLERTERFCTISYARLRHRSRGGVSLVLASGGHPPPYVVSRNGEVRDLATSGSLIGVFEHWEGADLRVALEPGDALVLYSDGVLDARSPGRSEVFGADRLVRVLADNHDASARDLVAAIERAVFEFTEGDAGDDVALLVARVTA